MRAALLALSITLLLCASPGAASRTMEKPALQVGDEWDFYVQGKAQQRQDGPLEPFAYVGKRIVAGEETLHINGSDVRVYRIVELGHGVNVTTHPSEYAGKAFDFRGGTGIEWVRVNDSATMQRYRFYIAQDGSKQSSDGLQQMFDGCDMESYPFVPGTERSGPCEFHVTKAGVTTTQPSGTGGKFLDWENVTVPAGSFEGLVVEHGDPAQGGERQWYVPEVCWRVKADGPSREITMQLLGWRCGGATGGALNAIEPPIDLMTVESTKETPGPALLLTVGAALVGTFLLRRR